MDGVLDDVLGYLRCPVCGSPLARHGGAVRCPDGHSFDVARQGYLSLLDGGARAAGDTAAMVRARADFLAAGHFASLAGRVAGVSADAIGPVPDPGCVVDVGSGTGYYLAAVLDRLPDRAGVALDASRYALRLAARAHRRIGAVGCDAWRALPVADAAAVLVLSIFAPRDAGQLRRVLHPAGRLLVVTPTRGHLSEIVGPLGLLTVGQRKDERLAEQLAGGFTLVSRHRHTAELSVGHDAVADLALMGPSAWHVARPALLAAVGRLPDPVTVTLDVTLSVFA